VLAVRAPLALLCAAASLALAPVAPASAQPPVPGAPRVLDSASATIAQPADLEMSIARDGTGGLVYLKTVGGIPRVFVSRLVGGSFQAPVQVDSGLSTSSSQPVVAAGDGGVLLVAFINSGALYVVDENASGRFTPPLGLASDAINPAISMSDFGKAYLAFAVSDGAGRDVRTAYYYRGRWALETPPLNVAAADDAGGGTSRPAVATAGDGIAIVVWGENGHIYSRRVWGTSPSIVNEQADGPPSGCTESSADEPVVGAGGDSSYASVAFREIVSCAGHQQQRVLMNRLQGSVYDGISAVDGLSATPTEGATDPQIAVAEYGTGWVTSSRTDSENVFAAGLGPNGVLAGPAAQINSLASTAPPFQVAAIGGYHADFIAWQQAPGSSPGGDIRLRWSGDGVTLGPEVVLSSSLQGPTDAADGLAAAGDIVGDDAVAWLQGAPGSTQLMVDQLYQPPGNFSPSKTFAYSTAQHPLLGWTRPSGWGPMQYALSVDGVQVAQTNSTEAQVAPPVSDGPHGWHVTASNPAGQQSRSSLATVFVDTVAPRAYIRLPARTVAGSTLRALISYADRPPAGDPRADASGVATVVIRWGDGTVVRVKLGVRRVTHRYRRRGRYTVTLLVIDKAGNVTRVSKSVRVTRPARTRRASTGRHP
jgi:PKD domain